MQFNGERKEYLKVLQGRKRPAWASVRRNILTVPGKAGGYHQYTDTEIRQLEVPVLIEGESIADIQKLKEDLGSWLVTDGPQELIFDDEPDRVYFAMVDGSLDLEEFVRLGSGTITFICPDPYKYSREKVGYSNTTNNQSVLSIINEGSVKADPIFEITADNSYTNIDISNGSYINRIGRVVNIEEYAPVETEEVIFNQTLNNLTGWSQTTNAPYIDGASTGSMMADDYRFYTTDYGTETTGWHGAFVKHSIGQTLTDFKVESTVELLSTGEDKFGKVEVYLLDDLNQVVCKMGIKDVESSGKRNYAEMVAGGGGNTNSSHKIIETYGDRDDVFWNFYGKLRIQRIGNKWEAFVGKVDKDTGNWYARAFESYIDRENVLTRQPTQIGIYIAQYGSRPVTDGRAYNVSVTKINQATQQQIPYIVRNGDVVTFDHKTKVIRINGEPKMDLKAFGGEFFPLEKGRNTININPPLQTVCRWRDGFL